MSADDVLVRDLDRIVQREGFLWGDKVAQTYFEPAAEYIDSQWAFVESFLSKYHIDYSNTADLACGHGRNSKKLANFAKKLTLIDVNPENISFCKQQFAN